MSTKTAQLSTAHSIWAWFFDRKVEVKDDPGYEVRVGSNAMNLNPDNERLFLVSCPKEILDEHLIRFGRVLLITRRTYGPATPIPEEDIMAVDTERGEVIVIIDPERVAA